MQFQILGPLEVRRNGTQVALGAAKQRALLAILLVHANELVSSDRLIDELWPQPPETAANTLQVYVGKLRKALEPGRARGAPAEVLITRAPGYMLRVEAGHSTRSASRACSPTEAARARRARAPPPPSCFATRWRCGGATPSPTSSTSRSPRTRSPGWRSCALSRSRNGSRPTSRSGATPRCSASSRHWSASIRCGSGCAAS